MAVEKCSNCKHFVGSCCRRYPPVYNVDLRIFVFPEVNELCWCGEFKVKMECD